jgi:uncharacterized protein YbcI
MAVIISNAFSLNMLDMETNRNEQLVKVTKISIDDVKNMIRENPKFISSIGHESTSKLISSLLGTMIEPQRISVKLNQGDKLIVFQLKERLPEGFVITDPEELKKMKFDFLLVELV